MTTTQTVAEVMTPRVVTVAIDAPVTAAAEAMRQHDIGDVLVVEDGTVRGILTDRDLVVRVLGAGMDPATTTVGDICSADLVAAQPDAAVDDTVAVMRDHAVRRLPVVDDRGLPVGVVSIGDLAATREPESALADISAAPPNW